MAPNSGCREPREVHSADRVSRRANLGVRARPRSRASHTRFRLTSRGGPCGHASSSLAEERTDAGRSRRPESLRCLGAARPAAGARAATRGRQSGGQRPGGASAGDATVTAAGRRQVRSRPAEDVDDPDRGPAPPAPGRLVAGGRSRRRVRRSQREADRRRGRRAGSHRGAGGSSSSSATSQPGAPRCSRPCGQQSTAMPAGLRSKRCAATTKGTSGSQGFAGCARRYLGGHHRFRPAGRRPRRAATRRGDGLRGRIDQ